MQYSILTLEEKATGLRNRMRDLEAEHYVNGIHILECESIGDESTKAQLVQKNSWLDLQYAKLEKQLAELEAESEPEEK